MPTKLGRQPDRRIDRTYVRGWGFPFRNHGLTTVVTELRMASDSLLHLHPRTCPSPTTIHLVLVSSRRPQGPRA